jgi:site-specific DNA-cytosine methylase
VKSRRAQSVTDDETWVPGEVNPTLNSFDVGDTRATTAIIETTQMENKPVKEIVGSLQARVTATNHESIRDGHAIVEEPIFFQAHMSGEARIQEKVMHSLSAMMGTGGNNTPMVAEPTLAFDTQFGSNANVTENVSPTLKASQQSPSVAYPIHDQATRHSGKRGDKQDGKGNGLGVGNIGDPMNTLTSGDRHAVAFQYSGDRNNRSVSISEEMAYTLAANAQSKVQSVAYDAEPTMAVRRLTPLECERLMGWPDHHTRYKADGTEQADTHRYKQCGNGVASPVAQWIAKHILAI